MKSWDELTELEQLSCIYSDMSKDAYGYRSRLVFDTVEEYKAEMDILEQIIEENERQRLIDEQFSINDFELEVTQLLNAGTPDRESALRRIMEESEANGDWEYLCFLKGLPYRYFRNAS